MSPILKGRRGSGLTSEIPHAQNHLAAYHPREEIKKKKMEMTFVCVIY
jgi:hypothetical protein